MSEEHKHSESDNISLNVVLGGGLELLFSNQIQHSIELPLRVPEDNSTKKAGKELKYVDLTYLIHHLKDLHLKERPDLFFEKETVCPVISVLVNDVNWELERETEYRLKNGDQITFSSSVSIKVDFGGGLDLLFSNQRQHSFELPLGVPVDNSTDEANFSGKELKFVDLTYLIHHLRYLQLKERPELFFENGTVRPGIIVLVNDVDWELEDEGEYKLKQGDQISFISTLHGG